MLKERKVRILKLIIIYTKEVSRILDNILKDSKSPIHQIIDAEFVKNLVQTGGATFNKPWFGQLMTDPQVIVYLIQVNTWMEVYNVDFQIKNKSHAVLFICMGFIFIIP